MDKLEKIAKKYFKQSEVVYITSDGVPFLEFLFAKRHADKNGLELKEYKKPTKAKKNGIK